MQNLIITILSIALLASVSKITLDMAERIFNTSYDKIEEVSAQEQMKNFEHLLQKES